jgi:large subunit ribosomal protein L14
MIQPRTKLLVSDNSGAKIARCIQVLGGSKRKSHGSVGETVVVSIISSSSSSKIKSGSVAKGVIIRTKSLVRRQDSSELRFDDNAIVLIDKDKEPIGSRIFGPVSREVKQMGYNRIASLASEVL